MNPQNYPENIEEKLGFDVIRGWMHLECKTEAGKNQIDRLPFLNEKHAIQTSIQNITEIQSLHSKGLFFQFPENPENIQNLLTRLDIEGAYLFEDELFEMYNALIRLNSNYLLKSKESEWMLGISDIMKNVQSVSESIQILDSVLDKEGKIKANASPELWSIYKKITLKEKEVRRILQSKFEAAKKNGWAGDTEITIRNERLVIPIIAEHKKKMPGFVHDDSASGKFLYIEPIECFEENNALKELFLEKKKEIEQILRQCTIQVSKQKQIIRLHIKISAVLDALTARSIFCSKIKAVDPKHVDHHDACHFINARHPILYLHLNKNNKQVVPLNFHFKKGNHLVVISGPNAGGKSIALKTIGLLQYFYQTGHPIPAESESKISIYKKIFIDIGDNQSLENNLSSYSSHLLNMKYFMEHADADTLYLIDELGNGTDPAIGSTIAQAILELMLSKKSIGIVTTHFGNLKAWASTNKGVQNARMLYDLKHLEPLFILEPDKPGSSFALEVASKVGISKRILQRARSINQFKQQIDLDELLAENERHKKELNDAKKRIEEREAFLTKMIRDYDLLKDSVMENKQSILKEAKDNANELLKQANQRIEETIRDIKTHQADKVKTKKTRQDLQDFKTTLHSIDSVDFQQKIIKSKLPDGVVLSAGMIVKHQTHKYSGEILQIKKLKAEILFGQVKFWLPVNELILSQADVKHIPKTATFNAEQYNKQTQFRAELDLRGIRGEEAIQKLDAWLLDAHLLSMFSLRIIHGRGFGILRKLIHEHLKMTSFVIHFEHESEQLGGDGVTIIKIK